MFIKNLVSRACDITLLFAAKLEAPRDAGEALEGSDRKLGFGTQFDRSEDFWVVDFISRYPVNDSAVVYLKVENVFDEQAIVSRQPDGARPNKPQTALVGVQWTF